MRNKAAGRRNSGRFYVMLSVAGQKCLQSDMGRCLPAKRFLSPEMCMPSNAGCVRRFLSEAGFFRPNFPRNT